MASLNKVILIGNVGKDPEVKYMTNGDAVVNIGIATTETWKDKDGQRQERTHWHNVTAYRKLAEIIGEYVKKGTNIYLEGKIEYQKYKDKEGVEKTSTNIIANDILMLSSKDSGQAKERSNNVATNKTGVEALEQMEEDIPF